MLRGLVSAVVAVVLAAAAGVIGWRVLRPAEVVTPLAGAFPAAGQRPPGPYGDLAQAPLLIGDRIRVTVTPRLVRADGPISVNVAMTPLWSYRRWPAEVNAVVAVGSTVVTRWSDGRLTALDANTGRVAWRADGPLAGGWIGGRTGAETVWNPTTLLTTATTVLSAGGGQVYAYDVRTGTVRWHGAAPAGCAPFTTSGGRWVCGTISYAAATGRADEVWPRGPSTPVGCALGRSSCAGLIAATGEGWLTTGVVPTRAKALRPGGTIADNYVLSIKGPLVVASVPATGRIVWRWSAADPTGGAAVTDSVRVLGTDANDVTLIGANGRVVTLGASRGKWQSSYRITPFVWTPGLAQVAGGYVAIDRHLDPGTTPKPDWAATPIMLAGR